VVAAWPGELAAPSGSPTKNKPGYCSRPLDLDCHYETICESCTFFVTTIEFRPTLQAQRDDAARKGQTGRQKIYDGLLQRLDQTGT
jgi:hypothetical protein